MDGPPSEFQKGVFGAIGPFADRDEGSFEFVPSIVATSELCGRDDNYLFELAEADGFACVSKEFMRGTIAAEKVMWNHAASPHSA